MTIYYSIYARNTRSRPSDQEPSNWFHQGYYPDEESAEEEAYQLGREGYITHIEHEQDRKSVIKVTIAKLIAEGK